MTTNYSKCKRAFPQGFTFIESLAVVAVISLILAGGASPLVQTLRSYKDQYELEGPQVDAQRAMAEFSHYGYRSVYYTFTNANDVTFHSGTGPSWRFQFDTSTGKLTLTLGGGMSGSYTYRGAWAVPSGCAGLFSKDSYGGGVVMTFNVLANLVPVRFSALASVKIL